MYSIDLAGDYRILHSFCDPSGFSGPDPDLLEASDGNFYGVTDSGTSGTLFRIDSSGSRDDAPLTAWPGELIQGADGHLYVPTAFGGPGGGTIIRLDEAGTLTTVYQFPRGADPSNTERRDPGTRRPILWDNARGVAAAAPSLTPRGTVFSMDAAGARTTLHTFYFCITFCSPAFRPRHTESNLFEGADGTLYGTTFKQFDTVTPPGQIFKISPAGDFTTVSGTFFVRAGVIQARDGRLYGTSSGGVIANTLATFGFVFRVEASGTRTVLHRFDGTDSANPVAELVETDDGSLYGTTECSVGVSPPVPPQPPQHGTIFRLDPATGSFTTRYRFSGPDGSKPVGRLIQATDGLIYGTTSAGGAYGFGTVFSLDAADTLTTLHHFAGSDGANPNAGVIQGLDGRLYGTTTNGGALRLRHRVRDERHRRTHDVASISRSAMARIRSTS